MLERPLQRQSALGTREIDAPAAIVGRDGLRIVEERFLSIVSVRASRKGGDVVAVLSSAQLEAPRKPLDVTGDATLCCSWIEPRAWLVIGGESIQIATAPGIQSIDVSQRFAAFRISGAPADDLLAGALSVVPRAIGPSRCVRARFAEECEVFVQRFAGTPDYRLLIDAPLAHFAAAWLADAAASLS